MASLLAVDLGLRAGLALYGGDARLVWYRSQNFGTTARMRRAAWGLLSERDDLERLVVEGGGPLALPWTRAADKLGVAAVQVSAEAWRPALLHPRERRTGAGAKETADQLARRVITWSGAPAPTSLRHDAAEAILIGFWGVLEAGWLPEVPPELRR